MTTSRIMLGASVAAWLICVGAAIIAAASVRDLRRIARETRTGLDPATISAARRILERLRGV